MILLAPMEGVLDPILREILTGIGGIDRAATEFIRVTNMLLPAHVLHRYSPELAKGGRTASSGTPVFLQFLGGQPGPMAENAAQAAALGAPGIDLNFGCPAKTVNRHDGGATLLKDPARVFGVTEAVRRAVPAGVPVTAKVRLGFDHKDFAVDIARAAADGGASMLTVHARTRAEMYRPPAHWEYLARMREAVNIPLVANGEIWCAEDDRRCRDISGCEHVALGRGIVARPGLAREIRGCEPMPWQVARRHLRRLLVATAQTSGRLAVARTKQWCKQLARTYAEAAVLFEEIKTMQEPAAIGVRLRDSQESRDSQDSQALKEGLIWPMSSYTPGPFAPTA
jgi:tRNA-dihydrouridine synthase C